MNNNEIIKHYGICDEGDIVDKDSLLNDDSTEEEEERAKYGI